MAKHLTWCPRRTLQYTNPSGMYELCTNMYVHVRTCTLLRSIKPGPSLKFYVTASRNHILIPKFPQIVRGTDDHDAVKDYKEFFIGTQFGKKRGAQTLMKILAFTKHDADQVIQQNPALGRIPTKTIVEIYELLRKAGIRKTTIIENPFLLAEVDGQFQQKMDLIQKMNIDINDAIHFFNLSPSTLKSFTIKSTIDATYIPDGNRFKYLAGKLQCDLNSICKWLSYNPNILGISAPKLVSATEYFLECGVTPENILSDPTAYKYSLSTIKKRIETAKELGVTPLKLWVLRVAEGPWKKCQAKYDREKNALAVLENATKALCQVFDCEPEDGETLAYKLAGFWKIKIDKLIKNAEILRDAGYSIQEIQLAPRTLHRRNETLREYSEIAKKNSCRKHLWLFLLKRDMFKRLMASDKFRVKLP